MAVKRFPDPLLDAYLQVVKHCPSAPRWIKKLKQYGYITA